MELDKTVALVMLMALAATLVLPGCDLFGDNTPPEVEIERPLANETVGGTVMIEATASDDDSGVEEVEFFVDDQSIGTSTEEPWTYEWNTLDFAEGYHELKARARDGAGNEGESEPVSVEVGRPLEFTFTNRVFTEMSIDAEGKGSRSIPAGESVTYYFDVNPGQVYYEAETQGQTSSGNPVGVRLFWENRIDVEGRRERNINLVVSDDYFFLYMRNEGDVDLGPLYVNYGHSSETRDDIVIPADGARYRIGYYRAYTDTQVRAYVRNGGGRYVYWDQGTHFSLPFRQNQSVTLRSTYEENSVVAGRGTDQNYTADTEAFSPALPLEATEIPEQTSDLEGELHFGEVEE